MERKNVTFLTQSAMIAAIYVVLTVVFAPFSFGEVQVRVSEMLTILPIFTPAAIPGLFVGCLIGNILGGAVLPDIIFGTLSLTAFAIFSTESPISVSERTGSLFPCSMPFSIPFLIPFSIPFSMPFSIPSL